MWGFVLYALGSLICFLAPTNMIVVLVGQFIKNIGGLPCAYVFMALFADCLDHLEWKTGRRVDGNAMSIYNIIAVAMVGVITGVFHIKQRGFPSLCREREESLLFLLYDLQNSTACGIMNVNICFEGRCD